MAGKIKGITLEIGGDTKGLSKALSDVNRQVNGTQKELKEVERLLKLDPKNTELLAQKQQLLANNVEITQKKLKALKDAKDKADRDMQAGTEVNQQEYRRLQREIVNAEQSLESLQKRAEESKTSIQNIKNFGNAAGEIGDKLSKAGSALMPVTGALTGIAAGAAAAAESTREYREDLGKLDTAFLTAGFTVETARAAYESFYVLLGEEDRSVEAVNHLAELCSTEEELASWSDICAGVTAKFGDSLPIEGLTEAANETAKVGTVTGTLADALNWAGKSEDEFNAELEKCADEQERSQLITSTLTGLYKDAAVQYRDTNAEIIKSRQATSDMNAEMANLGATVDPIITDLKSKMADMLGAIVSGYNGMSESGQQTVLTLGLVTAAAGPVLSIMGKMASGVKAVSTALTFLAGNPVGLVVAGIGAAGLAIAGIVKACENAEKEFYNMGDAVAEAADAYDAFDEKASNVQSMANELDKVNQKLKDGKAPAEELKEAEEKRAEIEGWFIDNYGEYISAEEQKNGIRQETIDKINEMSDAERERLRLELENEVLETKNKIPELKEEVAALTNRNKELQTNINTMLEMKNAYQEIINKRQEFMSMPHTEKEASQNLQELDKEVQELTGRSDVGFGSLLGLMSDLNVEIEKSSNELNENNKKITDGKQSIDDYESSVKKLIDINLGGEYESITNALFSLVSGQEDAEKTLDELIQKYPELAECKDKPEALQKAIELLSGKLKDAGVDVDDLIKKTDAIPAEKKVEIGVYTKVYSSDFIGPIESTAIRQNARGTQNAHEGLSVVNEEGPELIEGQDGSFRMMPGSPALTYLNRGDRVYTADETKKMAGGMKIPGFAKGKSAAQTAFETAKSDFDYRKKTSEVSLIEELDWWRGALEAYADDAEIVKDINEEIYALTKELNQQQAEDYKEHIDEIMREDERWNERKRKQGEIDEKDYLWNLGNRADQYRKYADEVMTLDYMTEEERLRLRKEYIEKAEDLDDQYLDTYQQLAQNVLASIQDTLSQVTGFVNEKVSGLDLDLQIWKATEGKGASELEIVDKEIQTMTQKLAEQAKVVEKSLEAYQQIQAAEGASEQEVMAAENVYKQAQLDYYTQQGELEAKKQERTNLQPSMMQALMKNNQLINENGTFLRAMGYTDQMINDWAAQASGYDKLRKYNPADPSYVGGRDINITNYFTTKNQSPAEIAQEQTNSLRKACLEF